MMVHVYGGAMAILTSSSFDPHEFWRVVEKRRVVHTVVVGDAFVKPMLRALEEDEKQGVAHDISSLKAMVSSGVTLSQPSKQRLLQWADITIMDAVGATEGVMGIHMSSRANPPVGTAQFTALPTTEIFDENDVLIPRGSNKAGFIGISGQLPEGYFKDQEKTAKTFRLIDGKRWGFTGDMGAIDEAGVLTFCGRGSNCINSGGEKVFPEEVEEVIKEHPAVKDCLVVGKPDDRFGHVVAAVVSLHSSLDDLAEELKEYCRGRLANYKLPRDVKLADEIQRAPNGKPNYNWAKAFFPDD
jgi:3-oxocholest-4-en-26-oate---CoA ligase